MNWLKIRKIYPRQWLLIEAIKARSEGGKRKLEQISVINAFPDSISAMNDYKKLKSETPVRELFVFHTSREEFDISERKWIGIRGVQRTYGFRVVCCLARPPFSIQENN